MHHLAFRVGSPRDVGPIHDAVPGSRRASSAPRAAGRGTALTTTVPYFKDSEGIEYEVVGVARRSYFPS